MNPKYNECDSYNFIEHCENSTETDTSIPVGAGGIVTNPTDLTVFINVLFNGKIVATKSLEQMKTIQDGMGMGCFKCLFMIKKDTDTPVY